MNKGCYLVGVLAAGMVPISSNSDQIYKCMTDRGVVFTNKECKGESELVTGVIIDKRPIALPEVELTEEEKNPESATDIYAAKKAITSLEWKLKSILLKIRYAKEKELHIDERNKNIWAWMELPRERNVIIRLQQLINRRDQLVEEINQYLNTGEVAKIKLKINRLITKWRIQLDRLRRYDMGPIFSSQDNLLTPDNTEFHRTPIYRSVGQSGRMIFGGVKHDVYLGCIDCAEDDAESLLNPEGNYTKCGSSYPETLYCRDEFLEYRDTSYSNTLSACNDRASNPPVIVDDLGEYYGRFVLNGNLGLLDSVCEPSLGSYGDEVLCSLVKYMCGELSLEDVVDNRKRGRP